MNSPYAKGTFTGNYESRGDFSELTPDNSVVIGHAFGVRKDGPGVPNEYIAGFMDDNFADYRLLPNQDIASALQTKPVAVIKGKPSTSASGGELGTWGELDFAERYMALEGIEYAILLGQAYHIGRVGRQADAKKMQIAIPNGLPDMFDPESEQWWIRSQRLWRVKEKLPHQN